MREKQIEQRLVKAVKALNGMCPKLVSCWMTRNKSPAYWKKHGGDHSAQRD